MARLKLSDILTFISIATAKRKFEMKDIIKYLLNFNFPLSNAKSILAKIIISEPITFLATTSSFKKINSRMIRNTVESCFYMLNTDGSSPYFASILSLSVIAYIITTKKELNIYLCHLGMLF